MSFKTKKMKDWSRDEVLAFFNDKLPAALREDVGRACAAMRLTGASLVSLSGMAPSDVQDPESGVSATAAKMIVKYGKDFAKHYPEKGGADPEFKLLCRLKNGSKELLMVRGSMKVIDLKRQIQDRVPGFQQARAKQIELTGADGTLKDQKLLRDHGIVHTHQFPSVYVVFHVSGGAQQVEDEESFSKALLLATMGQWQTSDVDEWLGTCSPIVQKVRSVLVGDKQMDGKALLETNVDGWTQIISNPMQRTLFLEALEERKAQAHTREAFEKLRELPLTNPMIEITTDEECIPYTPDADEPIRAKMPCGHNVGPNNCFKYFYTELMTKMGTTKLICPVPKCKQVWPWALVFAVCGLSAEEVALYQRHVEKNILDATTRVCPTCQSRCAKPTDVSHFRIRCHQCPSGSKDFCWECSNTWIGSGTQFCGNKDCDITDELNEVLKNCADKTFEWYKEKPRGPEMRACPRCHTLITHTAGCKRMSCVGCKKYFCFFCLGMAKDSDTDQIGHFGVLADTGCKSPYELCKMADRQTLESKAA